MCWELTDRDSIRMYGMFQALRELHQVEVLNFDDCLIRTAGAKALAKSLSEGNAQLEV